MEGLPRQVQETQRELADLKAMLAEGDTTTPVAAPQPQPEPTDTGTPPAQEHQPQPEPWEARFHSLQGKYQAEVPRLHEDIRALRAELAALSKSVEPQQPQTPDQTVSRETVAAYDDEFGKMYDLVQAQRAELAALKAEIGAVKGSVGQVHEAQALTAQGLYEQELSKLVPDHKALNAAHDFNAWLNELDGFSGRTRRDHGLAAVNALDYVKVARMYNEFKSTRKAKTPPPPVIPPNITPDTRSSQVEPTQMQQANTFSTAEVDEIYRLRTTGTFPFRFRGNWVKTDEDAAIICAEITQAWHEGRIA